MTAASHISPPGDKRAGQQRGPRRTRRLVLYGSLAVVAAIALAIAGPKAVTAYRDHRHQQFIESIKYDAQKIRQASAAGLLTRDERTEIWHEYDDRQWDARLDQYFALKTQAQRDQALNTLLLAAELWMDRHPKKLQDNGNKVAAAIARYESRSPTRRAEGEVFRYDVATKLAQVGIPRPDWLVGNSSK